MRIESTLSGAVVLLGVATGTLVFSGGAVFGQQATFEIVSRKNVMLPGEICEFSIKLDPCCNVFKKGHRIRVDVSSSNFPRFDVNPNTGEPPNNNRRMIVAVNTIFAATTVACTLSAIIILPVRK